MHKSRLAHWLSLLAIDTSSDLLRHPSIGASWEIFILEELWALRPGWAEYYFYRTQGGAEVDLLILKGGMPYAVVEIKHSSAPTLQRGYFSSVADLKPQRQYVVAPITGSFPSREGVMVFSRSYKRSLIHAPIDSLRFCGTTAHNLRINSKMEAIFR